eukprot:COSAG04_NODE_482_length_13604_cov_19.290707_12_plen_63_part_01
MRSSPAADPLTSPGPPPGMTQQQPTLASFFKGRGTEPAAAAPVPAAAAPAPAVAAPAPAPAVA